MYSEDIVIDNDDYNRNDDKYDLSNTTKQIRTMKFICEAPICSGKSTAIHKWISADKADRFIVIVPTVNIAEKFYANLCKTNKSITLDYVLTIIHLKSITK